MKYNTRKMLLRLVTGVAVAVSAALLFLPAANAAPGTITANVNMRSGPGTGYAVVDVLQRGARVDVQQCQGTWCYVQQGRSGGWVSATYLNAGNGQSVNPTQPGLSFGFSTGPNGPTFNFGIGNPNQPQVRPPFGGQPRPPVVRPPRISEVCFFDRTRFRGASTCLESGDNIRNLGDWADRISSIDNPDGLQVQVCADSNYRNCRTYTTSAASLGDFDDYIVSIRVR
jgi:uncharacterized protein YraI